MKRLCKTTLLAGIASLAITAGTAAQPAMPDPFSPNFTDELLAYSERLAAETDGWLEAPAGPPAAFENPYADFSAAMLQRMRAQDEVFEACAAGDPGACARREAALEEMARDTRGLGVITGIEGAYDHQRELGHEIRRQELYRKSREWGYSASDIIQ